MRSEARAGVQPVAGLDPGAVAEWMSGVGLGAGPLTDVEPVPGGTQNVMARFSRDGRSFVFRRGPLHLRPRSNVSMLREMRVLEALGGTDVPHPHLIAGCDDTTVLGDAVFYLMEPVDGFSAAVELPEPFASSAVLQSEMCLSLVDALAALGGVDHEAVGLAEFGKPDGFLERQVPRWLSELDSYRTASFAPQIPGVEQTAAWLDANRPAHWTPGIMHGDFHLANVMFARDAPRVAAIVDWEMVTIGDPLLDLGWLLATWQLPVPDSVFDGPLISAAGIPSGDELLARYAGQSGRDLSAIRWYTVLACFKLGIVLEGTHARAHAGKAPMDIGLQLHDSTLRLFERAAQLMDGA